MVPSIIARKKNDLKKIIMPKKVGKESQQGCKIGETWLWFYRGAREKGEIHLYKLLYVTVVSVCAQLRVSRNNGGIFIFILAMKKA